MIESVAYLRSEAPSVLKFFPTYTQHMYLRVCASVSDKMQTFQFLGISGNSAEYPHWISLEISIEIAAMIEISH